MDWVGLITNFEQESGFSISTEELGDLPVEVHTVSSLDEALVELESGRILTLPLLPF